MQQRGVHKWIFLVPRFWFVEQRVGRGGSTAGRNFNKAKFPFWKGPFWTLSCCSAGTCPVGFPAATVLLRQEACEPRLPGLVLVVPVRASQSSALQASAPTSRDTGAAGKWDQRRRFPPPLLDCSIAFYFWYPQYFSF